MNILLIEDNEYHLKNFTQQLSQIGTVTTFKSSNGAKRFLRNTDTQFDLVVCDHNILRFEEEPNTRAEGSEIYDEIRMGLESEIPFIHFSAEPCPHEYVGSPSDHNFYSLKKESHVDLCKYITDIVLKK